jgi:hypothetical protein
MTRWCLLVEDIGREQSAQETVTRGYPGLTASRQILFPDNQRLLVRHCYSIHVSKRQLSPILFKTRIDSSSSNHKIQAPLLSSIQIKPSLLYFLLKTSLPTSRSKPSNQTNNTKHKNTHNDHLPHNSSAPLSPGRGSLKLLLR